MYFVRICNYCNDIMFQNHKIHLASNQTLNICKNAFTKSILDTQELTSTAYIRRFDDPSKQVIDWH